MHSLIWCSSPRRSDEADDSHPTTRGIPIGMNTAVMNFESHGVRVLMSISDASFPSQWNNGFGADSILTSHLGQSQPKVPAISNA